MDLPEGITEVVVESMEIHSYRNSSWLVSHCIVTKGDYIGKRLKVTEPITGVLGKVEFED